MLTTAALALVVLVVASRTWIEVAVSDPLAGQERLTVTGRDAAPLVPAVALVALAAAGALSIARRVGRVVALVAVALAGAAAVVSGILVLASPADGARASVAEATRLTPASVDVPPSSAELTLWPFVGTAAAALLVACAVYAWTAHRRWEASGRFEASAGIDTPQTPPLDSAPGRSPAASRSGTLDSSRGRAADDWDALSRGDDPTKDDD